MSYFISEQALQQGQQFEITGQEARHITLSRRSKPGDSIHLQDPAGNRFEAVIEKFTKQSVMVSVGQKVAVPPESKLSLVLYQALISEQALDIVLQKSTELGASKVTLFPSTHSPASAINAKGKLNRWKKIMTEAAKQSDRQNIPELEIINSAEDIVTYSEQLDHIFLLDAYSGTKLTPKPTKQFASVGLIVGPEGGLEQEELTALRKNAKLTTISLGPRTLRAETAAIAGLTLLQYQFGDI